MNYYNEHDPNAAAWIEELIAEGEIADGVVDDRDVQLLGPDDHLEQYDQAHFFCGISGWPHALDLAGWPRDRPVWSASLPCQSFSVAGKQRGTDDERHLWPVFHGLVEHYRPECIVGEQVASKAGRAWFSTVQADLEKLGYWCGAVDLCAAGIGSPHIRQRLYWCAVRVADGNGAGLEVLREQPARRELATIERSRAAGGMVQPDGAGRKPGRAATEAARHRGAAESAGSAHNPWSDVVYVPCADGKARPLPRTAQSCPEPLADGVSAQLVRGGDPGAQEVAIPPLVTRQTDDLNDTNEARAMRLKGYGNSITTPLAAEFIKAVMEILNEEQPR